MAKQADVLPKAAKRSPRSPSWTNMAGVKHSKKVSRVVVTDPSTGLDVADPPEKGICYVPGHGKAAGRMLVGCILWVSFYTGMSVFIASQLPCWLHGNKC